MTGASRGAGFLQGGRLLSPSTIPRAWSAIFSRGESYEPTPPGRHVATDGVRGYFIDFSAKTRAATPTCDLLPAALAQLGLGWGERVLDGEEHASARLIAVAQLVLERGHEADDGLRWAHDVHVRKYGVDGPFCSALAQGQAASLFLRAGRVTKDDSWTDRARRAVGPLAAERTTDIVSWTAAGPVLEELPAHPRTHILNGWISGLWGLREVAIVCRDARAQAAFERGVSCLEKLIGCYDVGWWTKYSLFPWSMPDLAKPIYHRFHADQVAVLARQTESTVLAQAAARWRGYETVTARARVVSQKAVFVVRHSRGTLQVGAPEIGIRA